MTNQQTRLQAVKSLFQFMKPYRVPYFIGTLLYSSQTFCFSIITALMLRWISDSMLSGDLSLIIRSVLYYLGLMILFLILLVIGVPLFVKNTELATRDLKKDLFRSYIHTSVEHQNSHSGEGIAAINTEADTATDLFNNPMCAVISCVTSILFSGIVIFFLDYRLGLISIGIGLIAFAIQYRFAGPLGKIGRKQLDNNAESVKTMSNIFSGAVTIRAFNLQPKILDDFDHHNRNVLQLSYREAFLGMWQNLFTTVQGWLTISGIFAVGGFLVANGSLAFASLMMVPSLCSALTQGMSQIGTAWAGIQAPIEAAKRVTHIIGEGDKAIAVTEKKGANQDPWNHDYTLSLQKLNFQYPDCEAYALEDISLEIPQNISVAFVGESGSGKSTLLRTIIGLYERDSLNISLGNLRYSTTAPRDWREKFAYVDQSCKLFDMSIAENIGLGKRGCSEEAIKSAATEAAAHTFIQGLPEGYDSPCGERGSTLSGGQKQRIAIARALVRKAPVLVFDEATSALDAESERQIMNTIQTLSNSHIVLYTTHNLEYVQNADLIVVLENGRIKEMGNHRQLLAKEGVYGRLLMKTNKGGQEKI